MAKCASDSDTNSLNSSSSSSSNSSFEDEEALSNNMSKLELETSEVVDEANPLDDNNTDNDSVQINNRTKNKDYQFIRTYSNLLDAQKGVQNREIGEQLWTRGVKYETQEGSKICYTCRGHPKCNKRMLMVLDPASQDVHVSISSDAHSHINNFFSKGLNALTKAKVIELLDLASQNRQR